MSDKRLAWHFLAEGLKAYNGYQVEVGKVHVHEGKLEPCRSGLHASTRLIDALKYATGPIISFVECSGEFVDHGDPTDKFVCRKRRALWAFDASEQLFAFARSCAQSVLHLWEAPQAVKDFLETGNSDLRSAAWSAAGSAAWSAAGGAAWSAARGAAESAARSAAESAARSAYNQSLESLILNEAVRRGLGA